MKKLVLAAIAGMFIFAANAQSKQELPPHHMNVQEHARHQRDKVMERMEFRREDAQTRAVHKALRLKEQLLLSDEQYDKVYKVYYDAFKSFEKERVAKDSKDEKTFRGNVEAPHDSVAVEKKREEHLKRVAELEKPMKKILNEEQFKRWKELETTPPRRHNR